MGRPPNGQPECLSQGLIREAEPPGFIIRISRMQLSGSRVNGRLLPLCLTLEPEISGAGSGRERGLGGEGSKDECEPLRIR